MSRRIMLAALLAAATFACEGSPRTGTADEAPPMVGETEGLAMPFEMTTQQRDGRLIYETMCWTCHGEAGRGDGPAVTAGSVPAPPSFHAEPIASLSAADLERRFSLAMTGDDPSHPHMRFVAQLLKPDRFRDALSYVPLVVWPAEIPGSAMAGRAHYERLCMACHGEDGQGEGEAADVLLVPPARFPTDTLIAASDWDAVFERIREGGKVHGSSMPSWGVMLTAEETWDLVAYVASFQRENLAPPPGD